MVSATLRRCATLPLDKKNMKIFSLALWLSLQQLATALAIFILGFAMLDSPKGQYGLVVLLYSVACLVTYLIAFYQFKHIYHRTHKYVSCLVFACIVLWRTSLTEATESPLWLLIVGILMFGNWSSLRYLSKLNRPGGASQ